MPPGILLLLIASLLVVLLQTWWTIAYFYAYTQLKEPLLLLQVLQGASFGLLFLSIALSILNPQQQVPGAFVGILLILAVVMGVIWRRRNGINMLIDHYPRAIIDIVLFKKPQEPGETRTPRGKEQP